MKRKIPARKWISIFLVLVGIGIVLSNIRPIFQQTNVGQFQNKQEKMAPKVVKEKIGSKSLYSVRYKIGDRIGELDIPKLSKTLPIFHGANEDELEKGVGHFAGSVLPGEKDNSVLSGHRDTVFRQLGKIGKGDLFIVRTSAGKFIYKVRRTRIVDADDRTVIVPKPRATLTVTTCYPFSYIGDAPQRYILIADLISSN
ncbi:class D sortase [Bacillus sp. sid0103]|uniref:class D sortase n=1 Tax=Bacillus sp. sid0103 TaxID=2856337 RepID=UPI001C494D4C|nr:class D sortase [Bacillus sp. sid0103]MBV7507774.1 class D sortase [Bacillus sp. sid0103]